MSIVSPVRTGRRRKRQSGAFRVTCESCGSPYVVSRRTYREHCERALPFRCSLCQPLSQANIVLTPRERKRYRNWWLRRMPLTDLDQVLGSIFGPAALSPQARQRRATLAASAAPRAGKRAA